MGKKNRKRQESPRLDSDQVAFVTLHEQRFRLASEPNAYLYAKFAALAAEGGDSEEPEAARLMLKLLKSTFTPQDWRRFDRLCENTPTSGDDLLGVLGQAMEAWSGRPTQRPSVSSDGPSRTNESSMADSSLRVISREVEKGRPDLAYAVWQASEDRRLQAV
jgi:hypothetical protein